MDERLRHTVNEENAAGGHCNRTDQRRCRVVPAVIKYYLEHVPGASQRRINDFLNGRHRRLVKFNASISGAEAGCQAEVGSASAMAAAGLCAVLGGTPEQVENAAEIALEHHLGMTCDPVKGLVQVPCIERNGLGAIKAVSAASLALRGDGKHLVPLDACIETMRQTGLDMSERYKETSLGGLAVNVPIADTDSNLCCERPDMNTQISKAQENPSLGVMLMIGFCICAPFWTSAQNWQVKPFLLVR